MTDRRANIIIGVALLALATWCAYLFHLPRILSAMPSSPALGSQQSDWRGSDLVVPAPQSGSAIPVVSADVVAENQEGIDLLEDQALAVIKLATDQQSWLDAVNGGMPVVDAYAEYAPLVEKDRHELEAVIDRGKSFQKRHPVR